MSTWKPRMDALAYISQSSKPICLSSVYPPIFSNDVARTQQLASPKQFLNAPVSASPPRNKYEGSSSTISLAFNGLSWLQKNCTKAVNTSALPFSMATTNVRSSCGFA